MRSTFTKIFLSFWLSEFLILICTIFILASQFESNEAVYTAMFSMLKSNANLSVQAYESGGCPALGKIPNTFPLERTSSTYDLPAILFDANGMPLCQQVEMSQYAKALDRMRRDHFLLGERNGPSYTEGLEVKGAQGKPYYYLMRGAYPYRNLKREEFDECVKMLAEGFSTRRGRRAALLHHDSINKMLRPRKGAPEAPRGVLARDRWQIELMANLDRVPARGAVIVATWPKPLAGSGFPARCFAIAPRAVH